MGGDRLIPSFVYLCVARYANRTGLHWSNRL